MDENDYVDINNLKDICIEYDNTFLKLEIDYKLSRANKNSDNLNNINEFMLLLKIDYCCLTKDEK